MAITDEELQEKAERNRAAELELDNLKRERDETEKGRLREQQAAALDAEYAQIQAAIAKAQSLNAAASKAEPEPVTVAPAAVNAPIVNPPNKSKPVSDKADDAKPGEGE